MGNGRSPQEPTVGRGTAAMMGWSTMVGVLAGDAVILEDVELGPSIAVAEVVDDTVNGQKDGRFKKVGYGRHGGFQASHDLFVVGLQAVTPVAGGRVKSTPFISRIVGQEIRDGDAAGGRAAVSEGPGPEAPVDGKGSNVGASSGSPGDVGTVRRDVLKMVGDGKASHCQTLFDHRVVDSDDVGAKGKFPQVVLKHGAFDEAAEHDDGIGGEDFEGGRVTQGSWVGGSCENDATRGGKGRSLFIERERHAQVSFDLSVRRLVACKASGVAPVTAAQVIMR
ncbi:hypothetical protein T484DRAFT_1862525 [Cryptophyta sp. CCMP2293]|nr:hypothetical protein T484DRAFT_1862525 [Cryptophyta sp. CCMP2293]